MRGQRQVEFRPRAVEIVLQLVAGAQQQGCWFLVAAAAPVERDDGAVLLGQGQVPERGMEGKLGHGCALDRHPRAGAVKHGGERVGGGGTPRYMQDLPCPEASA